MKKRLSVFLLLVSFFLLGGQATADPVSGSILRVGFVLPLSGEWTFLGNGIRDAVLLAREDLRLQGKDVTLHFEDSRGELAAASAAGVKLLEVERVDAVVSIISGVGKILKPMAAKRNAINIGICSDTEVADGEFSFINYLTAEQGVQRYRTYFSKQFGPDSRVGIYTLNEAGFLNIANQLEDNTDKGARVAFIETFDRGTTDFKSLLLRNAKQQTDALLILGLSPEIEILVRQLRQLGNNIPITSIEGFGLAKDKTQFEGAWFVDSAVPNPEFQSRFFNTYRHEVTPGGGHAYDSVMLLASAFYGEGNQSGFIERFRRLTNVNGVIGKISVRTDGVIWSDASVKIIKNGRAQLMSDVGQ